MGVARRAALWAAGALALASFALAWTPSAIPASAGAVRTRVRSASEDAIESRLDVPLRALARAGGRQEVPVLVLACRDAPAPRGLSHPVGLRLRADSAHRLYAGMARPDRLVKIATARGVVSVASNGEVEPPGSRERRAKTSQAVRAEIERAKERMRLAEGSGALRAWARSFGSGAEEPRRASSSSRETGWGDVSEQGHRSSAAWAMGHTGEGVRVGVADTGVDFAHPDLLGAHATVDDPSSPYFGWPMAYDPFSLYMYRSDQVYGTRYLSMGMGWFCMTGTTVPAGSVLLAGRWYNVPAVGLSGVYHVGYARDRNLRRFWSNTGNYPLMLVSDETTPGVYDTVRVDINFNRDFSDDKPCTRASPVSYLDFWDDRAGAPGADGLADLSGGMVYWISDGVNQPPGYELHFGSAPSTPAAGALVCLTGELDYLQTHGTHCASAVGARGRIDAASYYGEYPAFKGEGTGGIVQGAGRDAAIVPMADVYSNSGLSRLMSYDFAAFGLDGRPASGDELQIVSCSFGISSIDSDGWDYESRYLDSLSAVATSTSFLFSSGNGGPGYGTNVPPTPAGAMTVGAATHMGAFGGPWDSIAGTDQVTYGDIAAFSGRGPSALGAPVPDIVAAGLAGSGDLPLDLAGGNGARAWDVWAGTSRSTPVAAGNLALAYGAFREREGRWPTVAEARLLLTSGAHDLGHDTFEQGAGSVDAVRSVSLAAGRDGLLVSPSSWRPGSWKGVRAPAFTAVMRSGGTDTLDLRVENRSSVPTKAAVTARWYRRSSATTVTMTLDPARESPYSFGRPDAIADLSSAVPAGTDLLVVRARFPWGEWNPTGTSAYPSGFNDLRLVVYDWTDIDGDGVLWTDADGDGFVDDGELDPGEYMRLNYAAMAGPSLEVRVARPHARSHDGLFVGLQHELRSGGVAPSVTLEVSCWRLEKWPWVRTALPRAVRGRGILRSRVRIRVPPRTPPGVYEGQVRVSAGKRVTVVPVSVAVAAQGHTAAFGASAADDRSLMPNGRMSGMTDWGWREEAGDWRLFAFDCGPVPAGTAWLVRTAWTGGWPNDIDTSLFGPQPEEWGMPALFGPYTLGKVGGSVKANVANTGIWYFQTVTGGAEEWVSTPASEGLHLVALHQVGHDGLSSEVSFSGRAGLLHSSPSPASVVTTAWGGTSLLEVGTTIPLPGLVVAAYGLGRPSEETVLIQQGATWQRYLTLERAGLLDLETSSSADVDLYVDRLVNSSWQQVAGSETYSGCERVSITRPPDGSYRIRLVGYSVPGGTGTTLLRTLLIAGSSLVPAVDPGAMPPGGSRTVMLDWAREGEPSLLADREGTARGLVFLGPAVLPGAVEVPFSVRYPFLAGEPSVENASGAATLTVELTKRADASTVWGAAFQVRQRGTLLPSEVVYAETPTSARVVLTAEGLDPGSPWSARLEGVRSADGDALPAGEWSWPGGALGRSSRNPR